MDKIREGNQNQLVSGTFKWRIENFSKMDKEKLYSQVFVVGGSKWRILLCQGWKNTNLAEQLSLYLGVGDVSTLPTEWSRFAHFSMTLVNQLDTKNSKTWPPKGSVPQEFNEINSEWGFTSFMPISELYDRSAGYLVNDVCIVEANLNVPIKVEHQGTETNAPCSELLFAPFQDAQGSGQVHTEPPVASPTDPSLARALGEVPNTVTEELVDFRGLGRIEKVFVPLLEGVCNSHPELIVCMHKRSQKYSECAFTALGRLLHFLKTTKVKDMTLDACNRLELLWEELESFKFDLAWLKPHVESAFDMTRFVHKAGRLKRLRDDVEALANELKRRRAALAAATIDHAVVKKHLTKAEQDINGIDMDGPLGYGI
ncbi:MATH domain and coiled-coil domain-containing protein At3g58270-like [Pyrus x bretschneideri]|uniref:MATH domain and coiled-coil domain-containing protein At3g58270-like n=1 Tax=Pyrus x bretschneideri TaxID=225117 RepID=UPI00202F3AFA|nr:MATH domain and coiled-coil domain-containing protein At3g58270-like [Pyrus x bretschneideri]